MQEYVQGRLFDEFAEANCVVCAVCIRLCVTKENSRRVELYSVHANPFKSFEFCVAGRDHFVRSVCCSVTLI